MISLWTNFSSASLGIGLIGRGGAAGLVKPRIDYVAAAGRWNAWRQAGLAVIVGLLAAALPIYAGAISTASAAGCYADSPESSESQIFDAACNEPFQKTSGSADRWETTAYVGLSIPIEKGFSPHIDFGIRDMHVNLNGNVLGVEANTSISLVRGLADAQFRGLAVAGGLAGQASAGIGWDTQRSQFILDAGAQIPHVRAFIDYGIDDRSLRAFLELNSLSAIAAQSYIKTDSCQFGTMETADQALIDFVSQIGGSDPQGDLFDGSFVNEHSSPVTVMGEPLQSSFNQAGQTCFSLLHRS